MSEALVAWGKRIYARWGGLVLGIGLVAVISIVLGRAVYQEWDTLKTFRWQLNIGYLLLASIFHSLALGATFVAWHLMVRRLGQFSDIRTNAHIYYLSTLAKRVPIAVWYIGGRLVMYQRENVSRSAVLNAIALESLLIGGAGVLIYLVLQPFYAYASPDVAWVVVGAAGVAALICLIQPRFLLDLTNVVLQRFNRNPIQAELSRQDLLLWIGIYLVPTPLAGVSLYFLIQAITTGIEADLVSLIGVATLSMLVGLVSMLLPAGFGLKELAMAALLATWMPLSVGVVVAIGFRILSTFDDLLWAAVAHAARRKPPQIGGDGCDG
jgi:hypothetical protein